MASHRFVLEVLLVIFIYCSNSQLGESLTIGRKVSALQVETPLPGPSNHSTIIGRKSTVGRLLQQREKAYVELLVVADHDLYKRFNSSETETRAYVKQVLAHVNTLYADDGFHREMLFVAKEIKVFTDPDPYTITKTKDWEYNEKPSWGQVFHPNCARRCYDPTDEPGVTTPVKNCAKYKEYDVDELQTKFDRWSSEQGEFDHRMLLSGKDFIACTAGIATVKGICLKGRDFSINECITADYAECALTAAHELGHNLGSRHDCVGESGCNGCENNCANIMCGTTKHYMTEFSSCSIKAMNEYLGTVNCLSNESEYARETGEDNEGGKGEDADTVAPTTVAPTTVAPSTAAPNVTTITTDPSVLDDSGGNQCPYNDDTTMTCRNNETCKSGEGCNILLFCKTRGGRLRCPKSLPYMCTTNGLTCSGSNCCERNASGCGKAGVLQEKNCPQPL